MNFSGMPMHKSKLKVMVLAGGPDRERPVSLNSGEGVAAGLRDAGHDVLMRDVLPDNLAALDEFTTWGGDVLMPMLHGQWGEGGNLQRILDDRKLPYFGTRAASAALCMDKIATKRAIEEHSLPTPPFEVVTANDKHTLRAPVVIKPPLEGSSIDLVICHDDAAIDATRRDLHTRHKTLLIERFIKGKEITVGVLGNPDGNWQVLPAIHIVPATPFYDYEAKYTRDDTQYRFDIDEPTPVLHQLSELAKKTAEVLDCRHLARVDMFIDEHHQPWIIEVNTIPGFTSHSLVPKAAKQAGMTMAELVDRLARLGMG